MANIIDATIDKSKRPSNRFGIKEVADVTFYRLNSDGSLGEAVLYLDTLKTSNLEFTAEESEARGGKGNAALISWDHSREATLTLTDALLSTETLSMLLANDISSTGDITISANTFPGTYCVVGETFARDAESGEDDIFRFIVHKAKVQSNVTISMEADGDPTVIDMTLKVLRDDNGHMITLKRIEKDADEQYTVVFNYINGTSTTYKVNSGATVTAPQPTDGHKWSPNVVTTVTQSAVYTEVKA